MTIMPNYVPRGYKTLNVILSVRNAQKALEFYNSAFGAETVMQLQDASGRIVHAEMKMDDTVIMLTENADLPDEVQLSPITLQLYVGDVEGTFEDAIRAGAEIISPIKKEFYGDRAGKIKDPFGLSWVLSTHMEDLTPVELEKRFHNTYS